MTITSRRVRHETRFRRIRVADVLRLTPQMARITFRSPELEGYTSVGFDDHSKLFFPAPGTELLAPVPNDRGGLDWAEPKPQSRDYTPRRFDPATNTLVIDFVVHPGGVASDWAEQAKVGDEIGIGGPRGSFLIEGTADLHLLCGDATALPAIGRRIEELPAGTKVHAVVQIAGADEAQVFDTAADLTVTWLCADKGESLSGWLKTLTLPEGEVFVFFAAEASVVAEARERFPALGLPDSHLKASNYWRQGVADSH